VKKTPRIALITGSARRLGREIALSAAESGYDIVLNYNSSSVKTVNKTITEIESRGANAYPFKADISKVKDVIRMFDFIRKKINRLDLLVNNSAIFEKKDFFDIDESFFNEFIDTNLKSVFFCSQEAAKIMKKQKKNRNNIINIASLGGLLNWQDFMPYSIAKAGVIKFTELLAKKMSPDILVNAIAPGTIIIPGDANRTANLDEVKNYPIGRFGVPADINSLIKYLIVENTYITGHTFVVDGGRMLR